MHLVLCKLEFLLSIVFQYEMAIGGIVSQYCIQSIKLNLTELNSPPVICYKVKIEIRGRGLS